MGIFGQSAEKKREKEIQQEAKGLTKELVAGGMDKRTAKNYMEVVESLLLEAVIQRDTYIESKKRMEEGQRIIEIILEDISEREPAKVRGELAKLAVNLTDIFHECTIRKDDLDFASTYGYINRAAVNYDGTERLMLQSELENLLHMVSEIDEWEEPDFCALALFCKYGPREDLADIENSQRNEMLLKYYRGQFWDDFEKELAAVKMTERVEKWIEGKVKQEVI
ncbi:MAG: hypothetical protein IKL06_05225 [Lachnospiraceae bacterium]|nr:hypothetical protein [Lachnospiraceae bacterium]